jgi:putative Holliday junction resolvase
MAYHLKHKPEKWVNSGRVLGMDHGRKTLGLALSDEAQEIVTPLQTLHRKKWKDDQIILDRIFQDMAIKAVILGYPLNMDGSKGTRCQSVIDFVNVMEQAWPDMPFFFYDERLSTQNVDSFLDNDKSQTKAKRKNYKDSLAAKVILDEALYWVKNT